MNKGSSEKGYKETKAKQTKNKLKERNSQNIWIHVSVIFCANQNFSWNSLLINTIVKANPRHKDKKTGGASSIFVEISIL